MHKSILFLSFFGIALLFITGLFWPSNPVVWLASTSMNFAFVRLVLLTAFGLLLVTAPPRSVWLRKVLGLLALGTAMWTIGDTYDNRLKFLDSLSLLEFSVCTGIAVLERSGAEFMQTVSSMKSAKAGIKNKKVTA